MLTCDYCKRKLKLTTNRILFRGGDTLLYDYICPSLEYQNPRHTYIAINKYLDGTTTEVVNE